MLSRRVYHEQTILRNRSTNPKDVRKLLLRGLGLTWYRYGCIMEPDRGQHVDKRTAGQYAGKTHYLQLPHRRRHREPVGATAPTRGSDTATGSQYGRRSAPSGDRDDTSGSRWTGRVGKLPATGRGSYSPPDER